MGLLDFSGFVGDDTTKDEFGLTQADRRQPLFTGLLKAGMLGMAAGENITPGARAQLMGQIGGAIGDIPKGVQDVEAAGAQMQLRRQQFATNKQKLDQQRKIQAYAQTPEFAEAIKDVPAHIKAGLKLAIDAGDVDNFRHLMTSIDANAARARGLDIKEVDLARKQAEAAQKNTPYGSGNRAHLLNILTNGDPASPEYYAAWNDYLVMNSTAAVDKDGNPKVVGPNMEIWRKPTYDPNNPNKPAATAASPAGTPPPAATPPVTPPAATPPVTPPVTPPAPGKTVLQSTPPSPSPLTETTIGKIGEALSIFDQVEQLRNELSSGKDIWVGGKLNQAARAAGIFGDTASAAAQQQIDRMNPQGQKARALIASLTADKIKALSGTAAGDKEVTRLLSLLPQPDDLPENIREKLELMERQFDIIMKTHHGNIDPTKQRMPEGLEKRYGQKKGGGGGKRTIDRWNKDLNNGAGGFEKVEVD